MHSKTGNGVNVADEFTAGKISTLPKTERPGRQAEPLNAAILAQVRSILTGADGALFGKNLYSATADELAAYNANAETNGREKVTLETLSRRQAFNACASVRRYALAVAKETGTAVGVRIVNEQHAPGGAPAMRWVLLLVAHKPPKAETAPTAA
jgi:hypothetical protein